jgi:hypothetical protein
MFVLIKFPPSYISLQPSMLLLPLTPFSILNPLGVGIDAIKAALLVLIAASTLARVAPVPPPLAVRVVDWPAHILVLPAMVIAGTFVTVTVVLAQAALNTDPLKFLAK